MAEEGNSALQQLFQQEFARMVAVIGRRLGLAQMALAEDIVSDTFLRATESWAARGVPPQPAAWLYRVANQRLLHTLRRGRTFTERVRPVLRSAAAEAELPPDLDFTSSHIRDSQLRMLFAICAPAIASEAQIGLALRVLCGFGIEEIAQAFFSNKETINKRLHRAREKLRTEGIEAELPPASELPRRLDNVLRVLYLLFNEGYYSRTQNPVLRRGLCVEAIRLALLLTEHAATNLPKTNALLALMCFHASRYDARQTPEGDLILYEEQDESRWDQALIRQGEHFLQQAAAGDELTGYHLEARIAYWHCTKADSPAKWEAILQLYNQLLSLQYSPGAALNRTFALYKANGPAVALPEAEKLQLTDSHFYFLLLGELYRHTDPDRAAASLTQAAALARTPAEKQVIQARLAALPRP